MRIFVRVFPSLLSSLVGVSISVMLIIHFISHFEGGLFKQWKLFEIVIKNKWRKSEKLRIERDDEYNARLVKFGRLIR